MASIRQQQITLGEMRASGISRLLVSCGDYKCAHSVSTGADRWPDDVGLFDLEPLFICLACGHQRAEIRPYPDQERIPETVKLIVSSANAGPLFF